MNKKIGSLVIAIIVAIQSLVIAPGSGQAAECLSQFSDSDWANGQPKGVQLGPDLILYSTSYSFVNALGEIYTGTSGENQSGISINPSSSINTFSDISDGGLSWARLLNQKTKITYTYVYKGANCSTRTVSFSQEIPINSVEVKKLDFTNDTILVDAFFNKSAYEKLNFLQKQNALNAIRSVVEKIQSTRQTPFEINRNTFKTVNSDFFNPGALLYIAFAKIGIDIRGSSLLNISALAHSQDGCLSTHLPGTPQSNLRFYNFTFYYDGGIYFQKDVSNCGLRVLFTTLDPTSKKTIYFEVGTEYFENYDLKAKQEAEARAAAELKAKQEASAKAVEVKKTTITCVKGKLTKKVTAVKPKCPAGYKVKK